MEDSLAVSFLAILIAAGSLALAFRADRRAGRAEARGLRAHVVIEPHGSSGGPSGRRFDLRVRNVGSDVARDVSIWLEDESGRIVSTPAVASTLTLAPGEDPVDIALTVPDAALPPPPVSFSVWMSWSDSAGHHGHSASGASVST
jgi:hypothetical protein